MTYTTIKHPTTGELYAVETDEAGEIIAAAGPLHHSDPTDADSLADYLSNQASGDLADDAAWLREEIAK